MEKKYVFRILFLAIAVVGCGEEESNTRDIVSSASDDEENNIEPGDINGLEGGGEEGSLVINELVAKTTDDGPDWVELYNGSPEAVDLSGYTLKDEKDEHVYEIPEGTELEAGGFRVIEGKGSALEAAFEYGLGAADQVRLFDRNGDLVDGLSWADGDAPASRSFGRYPDGSQTTGTLEEPTYEGANAPLLGGESSTEEEESSQNESEARQELIAELTDPYFELDRVLQVSVTIDPTDWGNLLGEGRTLLDLLTAACDSSPFEDVFSWYTATVEVDGEVVEEVGIRKKGFFGSLSDVKPALKIRFDKYVDDQFLGGALKRMTLNNTIQDPSKLNTCLTYFLFDKAGIPSPRCNYAKVSVNGDDYGIYVNVDAVKTRFIEQHFDDATGNLYEGTLSDFRDDWIFTMKKKTNEEEDDWSDIQEIIDALKIPGEEGLDALAEIVDLEAFVRFWAMESLVNHWDGYAGNRNNYHMYREPGKPFVFIPWGPDATFFEFDEEDEQGEEGQEIIPGLLANSLLTQRLYGDAGWRERYREVLLELVDTVWDKAELLDQIDRYNAIVDEFAHPFEVEGAEEDRVRVQDFVKMRGPVIKNSFGDGAPEWAGELEQLLPCFEEVGEISLDFETLWGTNGIEDATEISTVNIDTFTIDGLPKNYQTASMTAGYGEKESPDDDDYASLRIWMTYEDSSFDLIVFNLMVPMIAPDQEFSLENFFPSGAYIRFAPPFYQPDFLYQIRGGYLAFDEAGIVDDDVISGSVQSRIFTVDE